MATARVGPTFIGNASQANRHVPRLAFTRRCSVSQDAGAMAGTGHVGATRRDARKAERRIPRLADASRRAINLYAAPMARTADATAPFWHRAAIQTDSFIALVTDALRLSIRHDAATEPAAVNSETVRQAREPNVLVAPLAVAEGTVVGSHDAFSVPRTGLVLTEVRLATAVPRCPRAAHRQHG